MFVKGFAEELPHPIVPPRHPRCHGGFYDRRIL